MSEPLIDGLTGLARMPATRADQPPLIVAIHGGSYTSAYFDVPGHSLLDRAAANGIPIVAPDRPGYGGSTALPAGEATIAGSAAALAVVLTEIWDRYGAGTRGMVLIGHSIGGAIALSIAADPGGLPLIGVAVSGVGLHTPEEHKPMWQALPDTPTVTMPPEAKDHFMFGPEGSFAADMPDRSRFSDAPAPKAELVDIVSTWNGAVADILGRIRVPVHYRQAEFDRLWITGQDEVDGFAAALIVAPRVDAAMVRGTGHCMDIHHIGPALQLQQLGFALQCAAEAS